MKNIILHRAFTFITLIGLALIPLHGAIPTAHAATTYTVMTNTDSGSGSFRDALTQAADGDTITFDTGVGTITLKSNLPTISVNLTINGNGATIQGMTDVRGLTIVAGVVSIDQLTITGGNCSGKCPILNNGAAIYNSGTLMVNNSMFFNGSAHYGGGIYNNGNLTVRNSTFSGNSAHLGDGGGIYDYFGFIDIRNSTFSGNSVQLGTGGGIDDYFGSVNVRNSTFFGNSATGHNYSSGGGGGIYNYFGRVTVSASSFSHNTASGGGGGISNGYGYNRAGSITINNSVLANSEGGDCFIESGVVTLTGQNVVDDATCGKNGNIIQADPLLAASLADNGGTTQTLALLPGSPAIGAATDCPATDQRGLPRKSPKCDIGAFETSAIPATITPTPTSTPTATPTITPSPTPTATSTLIPLTATLATPTPIPFCTDNGTLNGTDSATRTGTVTDGGVFCRIIAKNGVFVRSSNEIGLQSVLDRGVIQAVDVFGLLANGQSVVAFNTPVQICLPGSGTFLFIDASKSPRSAIQLPTTKITDYTCANIPNAGTVVLTQTRP